MNPLVVLAGVAGILYLLSQAKFGPATPEVGSGIVYVGTNRYRVDVLSELTAVAPQKVEITAFDVLGRPIVAVTYTNRVVTDVTVLGDYPDNLVRDYHNQLIANATQYPEKFKL